MNETFKEKLGVKKYVELKYTVN